MRGLTLLSILIALQKVRDKQNSERNKEHAVSKNDLLSRN